jgi:hypothetical protein
MRLLGGLLARWSEQRIERWFGSRLALRVMFAVIARSYDPRAAAGFEGCLVYELGRPATAAPPAIWTIEVSGKRARAVPGPCPGAKLTLKLRLADFLRIGAGALEPVSVILQGRGTFQGPLELAVALPEMFGAAGARRR